jgi:hypothetical protein
MENHENLSLMLSFDFVNNVAVAEHADEGFELRVEDGGRRDLVDSKKLGSIGYLHRRFQDQWRLRANSFSASQRIKKLEHLVGHTKR